MRFDVRPILHAPGKRLTFQFSLDLSDVEFAGRHPISRPVEVEGAVSNTADLLELELTARTTLDPVRQGVSSGQDRSLSLPIGGRAPERGQRRDRPAGGWGSGCGRSGPHGVHPWNGHQDIVFGRLQRTVPPVRCRPEPRPLLLREGDGSPSGGPGKAFREQRERMNKAGGDSVAFERSRRCHNGST